MIKFSIQNLRSLIKESLQEKQWNKDSKTPRDYSKEYNPPGSKEQEERNKRKRDKRKHDKEEGKCPEDHELHHINGIENDEVECEPPYINRGRKGEGGRIAKDITIKIVETKLRKIIKEEADFVIQEIFASLAGAALGAVAKGAGTWAAKKAGEEAMEMAFGDDDDKDKGDDDDEISSEEVRKKIKNLNIRSYDDLSAAFDAVLGQAADKKLTGNPNSLRQKLQTTPELIKHLK